MRFLITLFFGLIVCLAKGQIVDDTTRLVYGAHTTEFTNEIFLKNNQSNPYQHPDTTVHLFEKYDIVDQTERRYQSLGFLGAPLYDLYFEMPSQPGRTSGFSGYDQYFKSIYDIKYFDTKSPFIDLKVILGGNNRSKIDMGFTRNVSENWNLGFNINRITADKQLGAITIGDRSTESSSFDIYSHYGDAEKPYEIAVSFILMNQQIADVGGVLVPVNPSPADFYQYQNSETQIEDATTRDSRSRYHLYHQYRLGSGFQLYHQADITQQTYTFYDKAETGARSKFLAYYPNLPGITSDTTAEKSYFRSIENETGLKGNIKGAFYRFYLKRRALIYDISQAVEASSVENYIGTYLRFDWKDKFSVSGLGELSDEGAYQLQANLKSPLVELTYSSMRSLPSFMLQNYSGNHHIWANDFSPVFYNQVKGHLNLKWKTLDFRPSFSTMVVNKYIYFDEEQLPKQITGTLLVNRLGGLLSMDFLRSNENEHFRMENSVSLQQISGDEKRVMQAPALLYSGRLFWRGLWFQNAVPVEIGGNVYFRTAYTGNQYTPVLSGFYLQDDLELKAYAAVDLFVNMKISNLRAFVKWTHFNQQVNNGYMTTPYYPGQGAVVDLGIHWLFFD